jgi:hypothetical protein
MGLFREYCVIDIVVTDLSLVRFLLQSGEWNARVYFSRFWKSQNIFLRKWTMYCNSQKLSLFSVDNLISTSVIYRSP